MNSNWVDCYIDKLLTIFPQIKPYTGMIDRWAFIPNWTDTEVTFDLTQVLRTEEHLMKLHGIERSYSRDWIDEALHSGLRVLMPCDLYFMPHAKVFYQQQHAGHYLLVLRRLPNGKYEVFDDHPRFSGEVSGELLRAGYEALNLPFQSFGENCNGITEEASIRYVSQRLQPDSFGLGRFAQRLLASDLTRARVCGVLAETRHMQHRLNGLIRMLRTIPLSEAYADERSASTVIVKEYMDSWRATVNLAMKGTIIPVESIWERLEQRLIKHAEADVVLSGTVCRLQEMLAETSS
jgi:hypothetical protein